MSAAYVCHARPTIDKGGGAMRVLDSRRLTGPSLMLRSPAVIAEVAFEPGEDAARAIAVWRAQLARMAGALEWHDAEIFVREWAGGAALVFTSPIDVLLPATEVNDWAIASATEVLAGRPESPLEPRYSELERAVRDAANPRLVALRAEARARGVPVLLDDQSLTLGMTGRSTTWPRGQIPLPEEVDWASFGRIPVGLVTGTNGKTTSTRLVARIARHAGLIAGSTSTDGVAVDGTIVEEGDYTGPAGALAVLRRPEVQIAVLETARGGILRRGLALESCDGALITNVSCDHLGDYGIDDLPTMARVKAVIGSIAKTVVLNAEDPSLVALAPTFPGRVVWFAVDRPSGEECWFVENGSLTRARGRESVAIARVDEIPITFGGRARYNIENALGAAALASALGISDAAIRDGLISFTSSSSDNPGRGNIAELERGVRVLVDFGHNPAGLESVLAFAHALAGEGRVTVINGMPGDRLDDEMREVARVIAGAKPRRVILRELDGYLRGREPGVIPEILRRGLVDAGLPSDRIARADGEVSALELALDRAEDGELIAILPSIENDAVRAMLGARAKWW